MAEPSQAHLTGASSLPTTPPELPESCRGTAPRSSAMRTHAPASGAPLCRSPTAKATPAALQGALELASQHFCELLSSPPPRCLALTL